MGTASCQLGYTPNVACCPVSFPDSGNKKEWVSGNENLRVESCRLQASHMHIHSLARLMGVVRETTACTVRSSRSRRTMVHTRVLRVLLSFLAMILVTNGFYLPLRAPTNYCREKYGKNFSCTVSEIPISIAIYIH